MRGIKRTTSTLTSRVLITEDMLIKQQPAMDQPWRSSTDKLGKVRKDMGTVRQTDQTNSQMGRKLKELESLEWPREAKEAKIGRWITLL